jgi:hypothetical protein
MGIFIIVGGKMDNNSKSESYIVREAENIIEKYLEKRNKHNEISFYKLKEKYERLKILLIAIFATSSIGLLLNIILK